MDGQLISRFAKKFRILTLFLIFSGALNIALLSALIVQHLESKDPGFAFALPHHEKKAQEATNLQVVQSMSSLSFRELVSFLTNKEGLEEGYSKRDLALGCLVHYHYFNIEKALTGCPLQRRSLEGQIDVFPGLTDEQFEAVIRYAYEEKWPLAAQGIFLRLQKVNPLDESLVSAFSLTAEFHALQALFQKTEASQDPAILLQLVREGNWDSLHRFASEQAQMLELTVEKRRRLLLSYLALHSPTAAQLLLKTDFGFALKRLDDRGILDLLRLLSDKTEEAAHFCVELLRSPRSDSVWQAAALRLYNYTGETAPVPLDPKGALAHFAPGTANPAPAQPTLSSPVAIHVVKEGESLWKIARQYKLKVDDLVQLNGIEKDKLRPGMVLKLPQGTGSEPPR